VAHDLLAELRRRDALEDRSEATFRCNEGKRAVTEEVIAGRLSLAEAAERFAQVGEGLDYGGAGLGHYKAPVTERDVCRNVITWAAAALPAGSSRRAAVLARLEAEYRALFAPDQPPPGPPA
jgi:hypothetical protein